MNESHSNENGSLKLGNGSSLSDRVKSLRLPEKSSGGGGSSGLTWFALILILLLGGGTGVLGFHTFRLKRNYEELSQWAEEKKEAGDKNSNSGPTTITQLRIISADKKLIAEGELVLESKGYIIPVHQIQVSPKVSGMVMELFIEEGMQIKEGAVLAKLETIEYQAEYDRVSGMVRAAKNRWQELWKYREAEVQQAKAELDDTVAQREQLYSELKRSYSMRAANALSPKEFDQAESSYKSMAFRAERLKVSFELLQKGPRDERIAAAKAEMDQAEAELVKAKWKLDNTTVVSPVSGTVLSKKAEKGNMINPAAFSNGLSASLCEMADLSDMEVDLAVAERDIAKVFKGQKCVVKAEAFPDRIYQGEVSRIMPTADRAKGAVPVRVKISIPREEEGKYLRPEMGAVATFFNAKK